MSFHIPRSLVAFRISTTLPAPSQLEEGQKASSLKLRPFFVEMCRIISSSFTVYTFLPRPCRVTPTQELLYVEGLVAETS